MGRCWGGGGAKRFKQGLEKGREEGEAIGRIRLLEKFLGREPRARSGLKAMSLGELGAMEKALQAEYDRRFKGR